MEKHPTYTPQWLNDSTRSHWTSRCCRVSVFGHAYFHCDNDVDNLTGVYGELSPQVKSSLSPLWKRLYNSCCLVQIARNITTNELWNTKRFNYLRGPDGRFYNPYNHGWRRNCSDFLVHGYTRDDEVVPSSVLWITSFLHIIIGVHIWIQCTVYIWISSSIDIVPKRARVPSPYNP